MKRIMIILLLMVSILFTGCSYEGVINTYVDEEYIESTDTNEDNTNNEDKVDDTDITNDDIKLLEEISFDSYTVAISIKEDVLYLVATRLDNREVLWEYETSYCCMGMQPGEFYLINPNNKSQIILFDAEKIISLDLKTGKTTWVNDQGDSDSTAIIIDNNLYVKIYMHPTILVLNTSNGKLTKEIKVDNETLEIVGSLNGELLFKDSYYDSRIEESVVDHYLMNLKTNKVRQIDLEVNSRME